MQIRRVQTIVRLEYDNGRVIVQQTNFQPTAGTGAKTHLEAVTTVVRKQQQALTGVLQRHGVDGMYRRSQLTLTRMRRQQQRVRAKSSPPPVDPTPPGGLREETDAAG